MHPASGVDRKLWAARCAVALVFFINGASYANLLARLPAIREHLGMSERALGLVLLAVASGSMVAFRLASAIIARAGSERVTSYSAAAFVVLLVGPGLAPTTAWAALALFLVGGAAGLMDVAMNAQAVEVERRYRRSILSSFHGLLSLGCLCGAASGSAAAQLRLPPAWHMLGVALLGVVPLLGCRRYLLEAENEREPSAARRRMPALIYVLGMVAFCSSVGEGAMADWAAVYMRSELHTGFGTAGLVFVGFSLAMMLGRLFGDQVIARLGAVRVVRVGGLLVSCALGAGLAVNSVASMFAGVVLTGLGLACVVPVVFRAGGRLPHLPPSASLATLATLSYGGFLVGPPAIGILAEHVTLRGGMLLVVVLAAVMSLLAPALGRAPTT